MFDWFYRRWEMFLRRVCCQDHTFYYSPGVQTSSNPLAFGFHYCVTADHGEGNAVLQEENHLNTNHTLQLPLSQTALMKLKYLCHY